MNSSMTIELVGADDVVSAAFVDAREAGDRAYMHHSVCPACRNGGHCLRCEQLDLAANAAEDRLDALLGGR